MPGWIARGAGPLGAAPSAQMLAREGRLAGDQVDLGRTGLGERLAQIRLQRRSDLRFVLDHHPFEGGELGPTPGQVARQAAVEGGAQPIQDRGDLRVRGLSGRGLVHRGLGRV
ncbi:hypothetical protein V8F63_14715 [Brevundimonas sp. LF-1]|uniref:hypothetical protein n=1 Tax=Brevundimonas sp. LF-1 TaxID=3126100 RepID=UPI0030E2BAC3